MDRTKATRQMTSSNRLLLWMGAGLAALIIVAAVIVIVREPARFDPGTPEAAVQDYIDAVLDDDADAAWALLAPGIQQRCGAEDLEARYRRDGSGRIILRDTTNRGESATVEIEFNAVYLDGPFDVYESSYSERFNLRLVDGEWRISNVPWPYYWCSEV